MSKGLTEFAISWAAGRAGICGSNKEGMGNDRTIPNRTI
jgi:hypothetical protein